MNSRGLALWAALLVVGSVTGFVTSGYAYAGVPSLQPRISELTEGLRETESELVASETRLSSLESDLGKAISQTSSLEQSLATAKSELTNTQADLSKANAQVESLESASKSREAEVIRLEDELRTIQRPFEPFRKAVNSSQNATVKLASVILNLRSANSQARVGAYDESVKFLRTALTLHEEYLGISADKLAGLQQASNLATGDIKSMYSTELVFARASHNFDQAFLYQMQVLLNYYIVNDEFVKANGAYTQQMKSRWTSLLDEAIRDSDEALRLLDEGSDIAPELKGMFDGEKISVNDLREDMVVTNNAVQQLPAS